MSTTTSMELSSNIMDLPCEVLVDILTRLSLKHVIQLQTVSKLWLRNISSTHFRKLYNMKSRTSPWALIVQESGQTYSESGLGPTSRIITISTMELASDDIKIQRDRHVSFKIVGREYYFRVSSNLIIFQNKVCNPITREIINLPNNRSYPSFSFDVAYIPSTNTYKIVHLFRNKLLGSREVLEIGFETLTLRDGGPIPTSWQSIGHKEYFSSLVDATCVDVVIYWLVRIGDKIKKGAHIISMESENEEFLTIGCPKEYDHKLFGQGQLADLNGKLCLAYYSKELSRMDLFLLIDRTSQSWVKEYNIDLSGMGVWVRIVGYLPLEGNNGGILINGTTPFRYNIREKRGRKLQKSNVNYTHLYYDRCFSLGSSRLPLPAVESLRVGNLPSKTSKCEIL